MKIFTVELDHEIYLVCDIEGLIIMTEEDWSISELLDTAIHIEGEDHSKCAAELSVLENRMLKAEPRCHEITDDMFTEEEGLLGVVNMPANMIILARGDKKGPMLALMHCDGEDRHIFRSKGIPVTRSEATTFKGSTEVLYEHPTKPLEITTKNISALIH